MSMPDHHAAADRQPQASTEAAERFVRGYIRGWIDADVDAIVATLAPACVVIESHGPVYRGRDRVRRWADTWFARSGRVERWDVRSLQASPGAVAVEWTFGCVWDGQRWEFDGASVARCGAEGITYLREYRMTGELYDWDGAWRE